MASRDVDVAFRFVCERLAGLERRDSTEMRTRVHHEDLARDEVRTLDEPDGGLGHVLRSPGLPQGRRLLLTLNCRVVGVVVGRARGGASCALRWPQRFVVDSSS